MSSLCNIFADHTKPRSLYDGHTSDPQLKILHDTPEFQVARSVLFNQLWLLGYNFHTCDHIIGGSGHSVLSVSRRWWLVFYTAASIECRTHVTPSSEFKQEMIKIIVFFLTVNWVNVYLLSATEVAEDLRKQILILYSAFLSKDGKVCFFVHHVEFVLCVS